MKIEHFIKSITEEINVKFFTGVPDSQLKPLCDYLYNTYGISNNHIIAANEGNAVALAAGYYLATQNIPCVYLQNSGQGNIINPIASLLNEKVYGIPCIFVIGWRGEPGVHDEPQHVYQGEITLKLLEIMNIDYMVIDKNTTYNEIKNKNKMFKTKLNTGKSVAFVVKKDGITYDKKIKYNNVNSLLREEIIKNITKYSNDDIIVSTTGKTSRELFEIREQEGKSHKYDFLTVGSMGHSSSIALGIALSKPNKRVWCLDGDGSVLMHMGALAVIGSRSPCNFIHVLINNEAHESVGGQPTVANNIIFQQIAIGCGYKEAYHIKDLAELNDVLLVANKKQGPLMIIIDAAIGSRDNLGRPTKTPEENKIAFMNYLRECD